MDVCICCGVPPITMFANCKLIGDLSPLAEIFLWRSFVDDWFNLKARWSLKAPFSWCQTMHLHSRHQRHHYDELLGLKCPAWHYLSWKRWSIVFWALSFARSVIYLFSTQCTCPTSNRISHAKITHGIKPGCKLEGYTDEYRSSSGSVLTSGVKPKATLQIRPVWLPLPLDTQQTTQTTDSDVFTKCRMFSKTCNLLAQQEHKGNLFRW